MPSIKIKNISKSYVSSDGEDVLALKNIDLEIRDGEFVCIVGPSGCGKSTLLEIVAGLQKQTAGEVLLDDVPVNGTSRDIGVVFQDAALFPWRTVKKNILFGMETAGISRKEQEEKLEKYLQLMNLKGFENKYPAQLSGGMRQRAGIARTLIMEPKVTLMDEPFSAVDHLTRCTLQEELIRLRQQEKKTVLFVTHDINEAVYLADRVILLSARPSVVQEEYVIDAPFPRSRSDDYLVQLVARIVADISRGAEKTSEVEYMI
ncbi:MAG: ABC transporter ATP-binding protein [Lachnospiraceae bacterium]|nr:ABC transporter ATP-binding protein [Lachnospiraceae bacterium]